MMVELVIRVVAVVCEVGFVLMYPHGGGAQPLNPGGYFIL